MTPKKPKGEEVFSEAESIDEADGGTPPPSSSTKKEASSKAKAKAKTKKGPGGGGGGNGGSKGRRPLDLFGQLRAGVREVMTADASSVKIFGVGGPQTNKKSKHRDLEQIYNQTHKKERSATPIKQNKTNAGWPNVSRNWNNYLKALHSKVETEDNQGIVQAHQDTHRLAGAVRKVLNCVNSNGIDSPRTFKLYNDQMNWLLAGSKFLNPFPGHFKLTMFSARQQSVWPAADWWAAMTDGKVGSHTRLC